MHEKRMNQTRCRLGYTRQRDTVCMQSERDNETADGGRTNSTRDASALNAKTQDTARNSDFIASKKRQTQQPGMLENGSRTDKRVSASPPVCQRPLDGQRTTCADFDSRQNNPLARTAKAKAKHVTPPAHLTSPVGWSRYSFTESRGPSKNCRGGNIIPPSLSPLPPFAGSTSSGGGVVEPPDVVDDEDIRLLLKLQGQPALEQTQSMLSPSSSSSSPCSSHPSCRWWP